MAEILPVHALKLKWLLSQTEIMKEHDAQYIKEIAKSISEGQNHLDVHIITIVMIEGMYDCYQKLLKEKAHA